MINIELARDTTSKFHLKVRINKFVFSFFSIKTIIFSFYFWSREADERIVTYLIDNFWPTVNSIENELGEKILPVHDRKILHRICGIMEVNALNIGLEFGNSEEVSAIFVF